MTFQPDSVGSISLQCRFRLTSWSESEAHSRLPTLAGGRPASTIERGRYKEEGDARTALGGHQAGREHGAGTLHQGGSRPSSSRLVASSRRAVSAECGDPLASLCVSALADLPLRSNSSSPRSPLITGRPCSERLVECRLRLSLAPILNPLLPPRPSPPRPDRPPRPPRPLSKESVSQPMSRRRGDRRRSMRSAGTGTRSSKTNWKKTMIRRTR